MLFFAPIIQPFRNASHSSEASSFSKTVFLSFRANSSYTGSHCHEAGFRSEVYGVMILNAFDLSQNMFSCF